LVNAVRKNKRLKLAVVHFKHKVLESYSDHTTGILPQRNWHRFPAIQLEFRLQLDIL
jgi:hypothetical protein